MEETIFEMDLQRMSQVSSMILPKRLLSIDNEFIYLDGQGDSLLKGEKIEDNVVLSHVFAHHPIKTRSMFVIFCLDGEISFNVNLQKYTLYKGYMLVVLKGMICEFCDDIDIENIKTTCHIIVIGFDEKYFQASAPISEATQIQQFFYHRPYCKIKDDMYKETVTILEMTKNKLQDTTHRYRRECIQALMNILIYNEYNSLLKEEKAKEKAIASRSQELYDQFINLVQKHCTKERDISFYADKLCVTPKYLSQVVKKVSNRLAGEWISDYVILEAKALIKSRHYTIQQISEMLNFSQQSFFGRYFKQKVGMSPKEYQNK